MATGSNVEKLVKVLEENTRALDAHARIIREYLDATRPISPVEIHNSREDYLEGLWTEYGRHAHHPGQVEVSDDPRNFPNLPNLPTEDRVIGKKMGENKLLLTHQEDPTKNGPHCRDDLECYGDCGE